MKRHPTNSLPLYSGKKKKAAKEKVDKVRSEGSCQQKNYKMVLWSGDQTYSKTESYYLFKPCGDVYFLQKWKIKIKNKHKNDYRKRYP